MVIWVRALAAAFVAAAAASAAGGGPEHNFAGKNTFSPTGRLVQQEYVDAVVAGGPACVGVCCEDGVALASLRELGAEEAELGALAAATAAAAADDDDGDKDDGKGQDKGGAGSAAASSSSSSCCAAAVPLLFFTGVGAGVSSFM